MGQTCLKMMNHKREEPRKHFSLESEESKLESEQSALIFPGHLFIKFFREIWQCFTDK